MENNLHASKRRGRPSGSKNKRKEPEPSAVQMRVLVVAAGADVINSVSDFANRFKVDVSVISTFGLVHNINIYQAKSLSHNSSIYRYEGVFDLLSLNGNFIRSLSSATRPSPVPARHLIHAADGNGNAVNGLVTGRVLAATKVFLVVTIVGEIDCIQLSLTSPSAQANNARQSEVGSSARGSLSSYGVPCSTPLSRFVVSRQLLLLGELSDFCSSIIKMNSTSFVSVLLLEIRWGK
ncbi:putative AT-hook motif nuclear-localized protein 15-29 [Helianthus debilis subsp. tardiflorus]